MQRTRTQLVSHARLAAACGSCAPLMPGVMPLPYPEELIIRQPQIFAIRFSCGIALFIALNAYSYSQAVPPCCDMSASFGVPFTAGGYGGFITSTYMFWDGVVANTLAALAGSYILGWGVERLYMSRSRLP